MRIILFILLILFFINCPGPGTYQTCITIRNNTSEKIVVIEKIRSLSEQKYTIDSLKNYTIVTRGVKPIDKPHKSIDYLIIKGSEDNILFDLSGVSLDNNLTFIKEDENGPFYELGVNEKR